MPASETANRLAYEDLTPELRKLLAPRVERLGYLGEFFQRAAVQPEPLARFINWTESLKDAVPFRLVEVVALTIASQTRNAYEQVQHERLALANGFTCEQISALVSERAGTCTTLMPEELAAVTLAQCLVSTHGHGCDKALARLRAIVGGEVAVGCLMVASRYLAHAAMANTWQLAPPVPSPLGAGKPHG